MISDKLKDRFAEIEKLALAAGLKPYDVLFFEVPTSLIIQVASYGLPTRYNHWSFGKSFINQKTQSEMGHSKIYELILNNDPSHAYLDSTNSDTINLLIAAHCLAHSDFFRNNLLFRQANETNMIDIAKQHAHIIDKYRKDYGDDEVDEWLDIALAIQQHIDVNRGLKRKRYDPRHIEYEERKPSEWEDVVTRNKEPLVKKVIKGLHIPPHPEKDLLWFFSEYANMEDWQKNIFSIVRRESYYFFPQFKTKIINEGWASYWHAELLKQYALGDDNEYGVTGLMYPLTPEEHLDAISSHEKVVQPGIKFPLKVEVPEVDPNTGRPTGKKVKVWNPVLQKNPSLFSAATRINPYYVGFRIFRDIKKRWDEYFKQGYMVDEYNNKIPVTIDGSQKIIEVAHTEDDVSFLRKYLTDELATELHLFSLGNNDKYKDSYDLQENIQKQDDEDFGGSSSIDKQIIENKTIIVRSKELKKILSDFADSNANYGVPQIVIRRIDEAGLLRLEHLKMDETNIDIRYAKHVLEYLYKVWSRPIELIRKADDKTHILKYDGINFEIDYETTDYPECVESKEGPSSW